MTWYGNTEINHVHGIPWYEAPIPRRWHKCRPQTTGWVGYFTPVLRCACGAIKYDRDKWRNKNTRKKEKKC